MAEKRTGWWEVKKGPRGGRQQSLTPGSGPNGAPAGLPTGRTGEGSGAAFNGGEDSKYYGERQPAPNEIRDVNTPGNWFTPFQPPAPFAPPDAAFPRAWDYKQGYNLDFRPAHFDVFAQLRTMSYGWGLLRSVIERRKDQLLRVPFEIRMKDDPKAKNPRLDAVREFFRKPDGKNRFKKWMRLLLEDHFVIDAATLYVHRRNDGMPYRAHVLDGATIKPLIDDAGYAPDFPSPAFQQVTKGLPYINFDETELIYAPMRPRTEMPIFGYSPVEQIYLEIMQGIKRVLYQNNFWSEGTMPELIITVPDTWTPQNVALFQAHFDSVMAGQTYLKSRIKFLPGGMQPFDIKNANGDALKSDYDEWLARLVCYAFGTPPTPFVKQMNRATSETADDAAKEEGLQPEMDWITDEIMNPLIQEPIGFGFDDMEFAFIPPKEVDPDKQATVLVKLTGGGIQTVNESREALGMGALPGGDELIVITPTGPMPLKEGIEGARQVALHPPELNPPAPTKPAAPKGK